MVNCQICSGDFKTSPDGVVLCTHQKGAVHLGCCVYNCSLDRKPCIHSVGSYSKLSEGSE